MLLFDPIYSQLALPVRHRFPIQKYQLLADWIKLQGIPLKQPKKSITKTDLQLCHSPSYIERFLTGTLSQKEIKKIGFPWSENLVTRTLTSVGATLEACEIALTHGFAANLSGGYHHAYSDYGSGFCIFNDFAVCAAKLINNEQVDSVVIFDCDVHQGDGTAEIASAHTHIHTCSIHCESNFPRIKQCSDYDFAVNTMITDNEYLETVKAALALTYRSHQPDILMYNAGADIYEKDELGQLNLTLQTVYERDALVIKFCKQHNLPLVITLGGGYQRDLDSLIEVHKQLIHAIVDNHDILI